MLDNSCLNIEYNGQTKKDETETYETEAEPETKRCCEYWQPHTAETSSESSAVAFDT